MTATKDRWRVNGLTLIELLVVVAIIAIVAALLFPVFTAAREKGRQATCLSNLRQIGLAFRSYMQDYDEARPSRLDTLVPAYISAPSVLVCPSDVTGNYAYLNEGVLRYPPQSWTYPQSYDYPGIAVSFWKDLDALGSNVGYILDRNHGYVAYPLIPTSPIKARYREGHILRLEMDGAVVSREVVYPNNHCCGYWHMLVYNPGVPDPKEPGTP